VRVEKQQKCGEVLLENGVPKVVNGLEDVKRGGAQIDVNLSDSGP
jgi:hypothetical protein